MAKGVRRQGRELALKILYSLPDHEGGTLEGVLADFWHNFHVRGDLPGDADGEHEEALPPQSRRFAEELVAGVSEQLERIDRMIEAHSSNWALDRMARVDLALLRMATFELLCSQDVPPNVIINEAIEIGKLFGTKETPLFINGILDQVARHARL
ncbi:MAG: transcription antitermination factor NusB [Desulfuromonadales bacterium]